MKSILINCDIDKATEFIASLIKDEDEKREILGVRNYRVVMGDVFYHFVNRNTGSNVYMDRQQKVRGGRVSLSLHLPKAHYIFVCDCDH